MYLNIEIKMIICATVTENECSCALFVLYSKILPYHEKKNCMKKWGAYWKKHPTFCAWNFLDFWLHLAFYCMLSALIPIFSHYLELRCRVSNTQNTADLEIAFRTYHYRITAPGFVQSALGEGMQLSYCEGNWALSLEVLGCEQRIAGCIFS